MASATLREIFSNAPLPAALRPAPAAQMTEWSWMDEDPDLVPFLGTTTWKPRKEVPLESFL